ncbi:MAG: hypothetical protein LBV74_19055 [Tannerella sp.]|nr:hypothetical protein [Tannerella sp.]
MKKAFTHSIVIIMTVLVFYGGAGINIISYCCNDCRSEGIEVLINDKCCDIHKHNHRNNHNHNNQISHCSGNSCDNHTEENKCNTIHASCEFCHDHSSGNCCSVERISFDWSSHNTSEQNVDLSPVILDLLSGDILNISPVHIIITNENNTATGPPLVCPRDYLSVLTILLM